MECPPFVDDKFQPKMFLDIIYVTLRQIEGLRDLGIGGLTDKINKLEEIEFLQFLNS